MGWSKSHVADNYSWQIFGVERSPRIFLLMTYAAPRGSAWLLYSDPVTVVADMSLLGECCLCDLLLPSTPIPINHLEEKIDFRAFPFELSPSSVKVCRFGVSLKSSLLKKAASDRGNRAYPWREEGSAYSERLW